VNITKISRIIFFILFFIFVFGLFSVEIRDSDFWWHLKTGEYIYQTWSLPDTDPFAYTSLTKDPVHPESKRIQFILKQYWLAQLIFYGIYAAFSFQGIIFLRAMILTSVIFLTYRAIRREGLGVSLSVALLIPGVILFSSNYTGERPQLFSFFFAFLVIFLLEGFRQRATVLNNQLPVTKSVTNRYLIPVPLVMLLWSNMHGGFIIGIIIISGYLFSESVKYFTKRFGTILPSGSLKVLSIVSVSSVVASFINPNGFNVLSILLELQKSGYKETILEAMSPFTIGIDYVNVFLFFILLILSCIIILINLKKLDLTDMAIFSGLAVMGLSAVRFIPFFTPAAILMIARYGIRISKKMEWMKRFNSVREKADAAFAVFLSIVLIIASIQFELFKKSSIRRDKYPEGSVRFLKDNRISGNMFNTYNWGGYLIWALYPEYKVFIDGRGLIEEVYFQYMNILTANPQDFQGIPLWKAYLRSYNIDFIITFSVDQFTGTLVPLIPALLYDPEWHLVYMDNISLIFVKDGDQNNHIIDRFGVPKEWLWNEVVTEAAIKIKDSPHKINFFTTIGDAFLAKKDYGDAKGSYLTAQKIDPNNSIVNDRLELLKTYGY
jgi:hypothetical protein